MDESMVAGGDAGVTSQPEQQAAVTPSVPSGVADATPTTQPGGDAETVRKLQEDISRQKSTFQRQAYEREQAWNARMEQLNQQLLQREREMFESQLKGMEPEQRKQAESQYEQQQRERLLQQQVQFMQAQMEELTREQRIGEQKQQAAWLAGEMTGIPTSKLAEWAEESPEKLVKSVRAEIDALRGKAEKQPEPAPKVTMNRPAGPSQGLTAKMANMSQAEINAVFERARRGQITNDEL